MNPRKTMVLIENNWNFGLQMDNANYVLQQMEASLQVKEVQTKFLFVVKHFDHTLESFKLEEKFTTHLALRIMNTIVTHLLAIRETLGG